VEEKVRARITLTEARLLEFLDHVVKARFVDIRRGLQIPDKTVWELLERATKKGFVVKIDGRYKITDIGRAQLSTAAVRQMLQQAYVQQTRLVEVPLAGVVLRHLMHKIRSAVGRVDFMKAELPSDWLKIGFSHALLKKTSVTSDEKEFIDRVLDAFLHSFTVSCHPSAEQDESEIIGDAVYDAIKQVLKSEKYFEKVLKNKTLTLVISLDLSKLEESVARNLLQWVFKK
jgi:DNA-binding MarR family transcriptional regulator